MALLKRLISILVLCVHCASMCAPSGLMLALIIKVKIVFEVHVCHGSPTKAIHSVLIHTGILCFSLINWTINIGTG